jgi:hypothetical protein
MAGHLSLKSLKSTVKDPSNTLAAERWNVVKEKQKLDDELAEFHKLQLERCKLIRQRANAHAVDIYEKLLFKMRWAHPPLPIRHRNIMVEYCEHLLGPDSHAAFRSEKVLTACYEIAVGTQLEKISGELKDLCEKIQVIANTRDSSISQRKSTMVSVTEKAIVKNEGKLRWMMETNVGRKDRYWTVWFLASRGMIEELRRYLNSPARHEIDEHDPDFGMTGLHYACKNSNLAIAVMLTEAGANVNARTGDGRTPLHLAAQFSTIEIVGHLLCLGVFYDAKDEFGLMAIDLAFQNKNKATFDYLDHWNKLIPPLPPSTPPLEDDLSLIPDEYLATPKEIFDVMSLKLQLLTRRLDGEGTHSFNMSMNSMAEIRLCEKHSLMCIQEGLLLEGIKSLRRRWRVASERLLKVNEEVSPDDAAFYAPSNDVDIVKDEAPPSSTGSEDATSGQERPGVVEDRAVCDSNSRPLPDTPISTNQNDESERVVDVTKRTSGALSDPGTLSQSVDIDRIIANFNKPYKGDQSSNVPVCDSTTNTDEIPVVIQTSPLGSPASVLRKGPSRLSINSQTAAAAGRDLAEVSIQHRFEGFALTVLCECILLPNLDNQTALVLYVRISELVLFLFDRIRSRRKYKESLRTTYLPPTRKQMQELQQQTIPNLKAEVTFESSVAELASAKSISRVITSARKLKCVGSGESCAESSQSALLKEGVPPCSSSTSLSGSCIQLQTQVSEESRLAHSSSQDLVFMKSSHVGTLSKISAADVSHVDSKVYPAAKRCGAGHSIEQPPTCLLSPEQIRAQKLADLLSLGHIAAQGALNSHYAIHADKSFLGQDALSLCPLLELKGEMFEREYQWHAAIDLLEHAEIISGRCLGYCHEETIRIMLAAVKLHLKCANVESYRAACVKATDMSRRLDEWASSSSDARARSEILGRQCAEVIALSKLLETSTKENDEGDEDDTTRDGESTLSSSFPSLLNKTVKGTNRSDSAAVFVTNIKRISSTFATGRSHYAAEVRSHMRTELNMEKRKQRKMLRTLEAKEASVYREMDAGQHSRVSGNDVSGQRKSVAPLSASSTSLVESLAVIADKQKAEDAARLDGPLNTMEKVKIYQTEYLERLAFCSLEESVKTTELLGQLRQTAQQLSGVVGVP